MSSRRLRLAISEPTRMWPGWDTLRASSRRGRGARHTQSAKLCQTSRTSPFGEKGCAVRNAAISTSRDSKQRSQRVRVTPLRVRHEPMLRVEFELPLLDRNCPFGSPADAR